ncbi:hypothetical protein AMECASPLE_032758 [Ameca splendens]|uniref:Uncharacterized protein n=1 Tax=Ameca splendens TaxID=208324 RepID=A0ABV0XVK9_9TELE
MKCLIGSEQERRKLVSELNLFKNVFSSLALSRHPSVRSSFCLKPVIFFIPDHTSLILFCWSLLSSFFLYTSLLSLILTLSCFCILLNNSPSPSLNALFCS